MEQTPASQSARLHLTRPLAFIDIESTGLDTAKDRVIELGLVVLKPDGTRIKWSSRFNPGRPIPPESTQVHGVTDSDVADAPPFRAWAVQLHKELHGMDLAGYNLRRFDLPILDEEFRRCGLKLNVEDVLIIDCFGIFANKEPRQLADAVRRYCGRDYPEAHAAAADAAATVDVFLGELRAHADLQAMDLAAIADFSLTGINRPVDLAGKLYFDTAGELRFNFGKHTGERVEDNSDYAHWILNEDFPGSTLDVLKAELGIVILASSSNGGGHSLPGTSETALVMEQMPPWRSVEETVPEDATERGCTACGQQGATLRHNDTELAQRQVRNRIEELETRNKQLASDLRLLRFHEPGIL